MIGFAYDTIYNTNIRRLSVDSKISDEAVIEIQSGIYDILWLNGNDFERLNDIDMSKVQINDLYFQTGKAQDISWVSKLDSLKIIRLLGKTKGKINFSNLDKLRTVQMELSKTTRELLYCPLKLETLGVSRLDTSFNDFNPKLASNLVSLGFSGQKITSLDGISNFTKLERVSIDSSKSLVNISQLEELKKLKKLVLQGCNNVNYKKALGKLAGLEILFYENKVLESLEVLLPANKLRRLCLGDNTIIEDKKVEVALKFPSLEFMSFSNKKGYKYSALELRGIIENKTNQRG
jgi:Leucine-rich repeat (LRR) protein